MLEKAGGIMLPVDNDVREQILTHKGNLVISASAGTGKTYTTVMRIKRDVENNNSYKTFAAITFTRKAAKEIVNRLGINRGDGFVGTNDNFVWSEIILPFMYDVYGSNFKKSINPDYSDINKITNFDEGIEKIRDTDLMCKYDNNRKNFAFELALDILKKSHSARRFLKSKYFRVFIDEYQDSDVDMHNFFMYLCDNLEIPLFIVGDEKQSIYGFRGAYSDGFKELFTKDGFKLFNIWHNFRSNKAIQNYSNMFIESVQEHYEKINFNDEVIMYKYSSKDDACHYIEEWIDIEEKCIMLNYGNANAKVWSDKLNDVGLDFVYIPHSPIDNPNLDSEHIWIARSIANYILTKRYSEYDFRDEIPIPENFKISMLKSKLKAIKEQIHDMTGFSDACILLYNYLGYDDYTDKINNEIEKLFDTVSVDDYIPTYNISEYILTSGTVHSSKGLEFNQVIINGGDYNFNRKGARFLHYVAVSRPEQRLLIISHLGNDYNRYLGYINSSIKESKELGHDIKIEDVISLVE